MRSPKGPLDRGSTVLNLVRRIHGEKIVDIKNSFNLFFLTGINFAKRIQDLLSNTG